MGLIERLKFLTCDSFFMIKQDIRPLAKFRLLVPLSLFTYAICAVVLAVNYSVLSTSTVTESSIENKIKGDGWSCTMLSKYEDTRTVDLSTVVDLGRRTLIFKNTYASEITYLNVQYDKLYSTHQECVDAFSSITLYDYCSITGTPYAYTFT